MNDGARALILLEDLNDKFDTMMEFMISMRQELDEVKSQTAEIPEMKADIKTIKFTLTAANRQVADHERRITKLETARA